MKLDLFTAESFGKRCFIRLFDVASVVVVCVVISLGFVEPAFAYVDPSVMTYTIQALAGVAVALGAVAGVALRRTRKWLLKVLKIDENANKEKEGAVRRLSHEEALELDAITPDYTKHSNEKGETELTWKARFGIAFLATLLCGFTLGISAPFELVAGNASNLTYGLMDIWPVMAGVTALCTIALSLLVSLLRGKAFSVATLFLCSCGVCMYVQSLFMNGGLILNDNESIDWVGTFLPSMIISAVVWLAIIVAPQVFAARNRHGARVGVVAVSLFVILVQVIGVGSLFVGGKTDGGSVSPSVVTQKGVFEVSDKSNVIFMVVDHFDERELDKLVAANSHLLDFLPNATVYRNTMETMTPTEFALPYMVTAVRPEIGEDINGSYLCRRYTEGTFLKSLEDAGYSVGIYTDTLRLQHLSNEQVWNSVGCHTENIHPTDKQHLNRKGTLKILVKASLYRNLPWVLKPPFLYTTSDLNKKMVARSRGKSSFDDQPFVIDDVAFYHKVLDKGLHIDKDDDRGNFRLIHFDGNHRPWTKNEKVEVVKHTPEGRDADAIGSLKIVEAYIRELKDLGVYDKSTIIITADHGDWETRVLPTDVSVPILIVKPATGGGESVAPVFSDAPVGHEDLFATVLDAMGADGSQYGNTLSQIEAQYGADPSARKRETYMAAANEGFTKIIDLFLFTVNGDARNWDDWTYTGTTWHVEDE